jgi:ABC-type transport system substrate-binding protein
VDLTADATAVNTIVSSYISQSNSNRVQLQAGDIALTALENGDDFAAATGILSYLRAIGANPRVGADGQYQTESGIPQEFVRLLNQAQRAEPLTETQRRSLQREVRQALNEVVRRQAGFDQVLEEQLRPFNVSEKLLSGAIGGVRGMPRQEAATPAPPPPAPGEQAIPQITTDAEYNLLPPGTVFIDPEGVRREKRQ